MCDLTLLLSTQLATCEVGWPEKLVLLTNKLTNIRRIPPDTVYYQELILKEPCVYPSIKTQLTVFS